jgi:hypothetical protein
MKTETAFHFHEATMTATDPFLLQRSVASGCAGTISQSGRRPFILQRDRYRSLFIRRHS